MKDILVLASYDEIAMTLQPLRYEILRLMREPMTVNVAAAHLKVSSQRIAYHVRKLLDAGLLDIVDRRKTGSSVERVLQATAVTFVLGDDFELPPDLQAELVAKMYEIAKARATAAFQAGTANLQVFDEEIPTKFFLGQWQLSHDTHKELVRELDVLVEKFSAMSSSEDDSLRSSVLLTAHIT
jgi:DNA-binding transcriptional ArsR family regulator